MNQPLKLLVVEDDAPYAGYVVDTLQNVASMSPDVRHVSRLQDAVDQIRTTAWDAVILDLNLPDSRGVDTFTRLAAIAPHVPIVVLTSIQDESAAITSLRRGAQEYVVKGDIDALAFHTTIRHAIARHTYSETFRTTEARFRSLVEGAVQAILIHRGGIVQFANHALATLIGLRSPDDAIGREIWSFIHEHDRPLVKQYIRAREAKQPAPHRYDIRVVRTDGEVRWADCAVSEIHWDGELTIMAALVDVTDRHLAVDQLRASDERFRLIADNIREAFVILELPTGRALYLSRVWEDIWGQPVEAAYANPQSWFETIHPDDRAAVLAADRAVRDGRPMTVEFRVLRADGSLPWLRARIVPVRDGSGGVHRMVGLIEDITEMRNTEQQLRQAQKMEAIGVLAGGIAHDFNNLLVVIGGYAELLAQDLGPLHPLRADLDEIRAASRSAESLTRQLLAFSRKQIRQPQVLNLNDVLVRVERLLRRVIGEDIVLAMHLGAPLPHVCVDPGQIEQIVMNLAVNARDAMPTGGRLTIETTSVELDQAYAEQHPGSTVGPHVMFAVSDTGVGIDAATQQRLFEPFFTTKPVGRGTGLGLAMVYGIVKQSQGSIWVYSEVGQGSTFKIYLPVVADDDAAAPAEPADTSILEGHETILLLEDQPEVRAVIVATLRRHGYTVVPVATASEALAIAGEATRRFDVLLCDVVLPDMSGRDVARTIVADRPEVRVLYMSGYTDDAIVRHGVLDRGLAFIQKPFAADALLRKVRAVLDGERPSL